MIIMRKIKLKMMRMKKIKKIKKSKKIITNKVKEDNEPSESLAFKKLKAWQSKRRTNITQKHKIKKDKFTNLQNIVSKTAGIETVNHKASNKKTSLKRNPWISRSRQGKSKDTRKDKMESKIARWKRGVNDKDDTKDLNKEQNSQESVMKSKRGIKRKQKFKKPPTKKIKLPID
mmetsp:Transcript_52085/g.46777  ORF Transcript_52085/g.46777 Transcript_52085/m.46777 type:complete len:174 (-) Transcript_52085:2-523(-)